jgi:oligopeptide transport system permease protein
MATTTTVAQRTAAELNVLREQRSLWRDAFYRLRRNRAAMAGLIVIVAFALVAILAPLIAPYDPVWNWYAGARSCAPGEQGCTTGPTLRNPVWMPNSDPRFLFGTDEIGRDVLSRLIWSARISMVVGFIPVAIVLVIGVAVGLTSGYFGGRMDGLLMRLVDVVYAFPSLLLLIIIMATLRGTELARLFSGLLLIFLALSVVGWEGFARLVRGQVLSLKEKEFVEAARAIGVSAPGIMLRHLLPNALAPIIVTAAFSVPGAIIAEATLSYLGIGIIPPTPSWGVMINEGFGAIYGAPFLVLLPAFCVAIVLLSFTFLGDGLRDALDPRMKI